MGPRCGRPRAAEEANSSKTRFLKVIGYELRGPLNAVIGYSEMLEEDLAHLGAEQQRADAAQITSAGKRLLVLLNDILRVSQKEANAPLLQDVETDVSTLLAEFSPVAAKTAAGYGNSFVLDVAPLPAVILDREKLVACLITLITHICTTASNCQITLHVWSDGQRILFEVISDGVARASSSAPAQHDENSEVTDLAVARKNARLMAGDISVEFIEGRVSMATFWLPVFKQTDFAPAA